MHVHSGHKEHTQYIAAITCVFYFQKCLRAIGPTPKKNMKVVSTALLIGVLASFLCVLHVHAAIEITKNNDKVASLKEQIKKEALKDPKLASKLIELSLKKVPLPKKPEIIMNKMPVSGALCSSCVDLLDFALADLLAALDSGVVFSCLRLCNSVANLGPYAVELCDVVCTGKSLARHV